VTLVNVAKQSRHSGEQLRTVECSLCGARYGRDYHKFACHLAREHTPADLGLGGESV
jgi:hypothetical protein